MALLTGLASYAELLLVIGVIPVAPVSYGIRRLAGDTDPIGIMADGSRTSTTGGSSTYFST